MSYATMSAGASDACCACHFFLRHAVACVMDQACPMIAAMSTRRVSSRAATRDKSRPLVGVSSVERQPFAVRAREVRSRRPRWRKHAAQPRGDYYYYSLAVVSQRDYRQAGYAPPGQQSFETPSKVLREHRDARRGPSSVRRPRSALHDGLLFRRNLLRFLAGEA